jgi:acetolactate synthase-1/2/3 large subunit
VAEAQQIQPALERARASGRPACVDVIVDPNVFSSGTMDQTMYK